MVTVSKAYMHQRILTQLNGAVIDKGNLKDIPYKPIIEGLGSLAFYAFLLSAQSSVRPEGEYRIQLMLPRQEKKERGQFEFIPDTFSILLGWSPREDIFVLWDAYAHDSFTYCQNIQVKGEAVWLARSRGITNCERVLRNGRGTETVIVCCTNRILEAVHERIRFSAARLQNER